MTAKDNCSRLVKPCISVRIDPCDCRYYYECSPQDIIRRSCAKGAVFNAKTKNCFLVSHRICDPNKPWTRCELEEFGISKNEIQSVSTCRKFWPQNMKNWTHNSSKRKPKEHQEATPKTVSMTTSPGTLNRITTRSLVGTDYHPFSQVSVVQSTEFRNNINASSRVPVPNGFDFDSRATKTYIPVLICGFIALFALVSIIILWKKRSDVKTFVAGFCCVGRKKKPKAICNPGYGNTMARSDLGIDQTTGEHLYHEISSPNLVPFVHRPLPQTPPQQQQRPSTFSGFGSPDVAIRKEQQQIQWTNSACDAYDKLTSSHDRAFIDAQERFMSENQFSISKNRKQKTSGKIQSADHCSPESPIQAVPKKNRKRRNAKYGSQGVDYQKRSVKHCIKVGETGRLWNNPGKLVGIKEDLELSPPSPTPSLSSSPPSTILSLPSLTATEALKKEASSSSSTATEAVATASITAETPKAPTSKRTTATTTAVTALQEKLAVTPEASASASSITTATTPPATRSVRP